MLRRAGSAVVVVVALSCAALAATAEPAYALAPTPTQVVNDPANWARVWETATRPSTATPTVTSTSGQGALFRAGRAAGAMPALRGLGTIALGAAALQIGWKIGRTIDTQWLHFSGDYGTTTKVESHPSNYIANKPISWKWVLAGAVVNESTFTAPVDGFYLLYSECASASPGCTPAGTYAGLGQSTATLGGACNMVAGSNIAVLANLQASAAGTCITSGSHTNVAFIYRTETSMQDDMEPDAFEPWVAQTADKSTTGQAIPADPGTGSGTATSVRAALLGGDDEADAAIAQVIQPGYDEEQIGTIVLPAPDPNETVVEYRQRLRDMGWLGTATTAAEVTDASSPLWGPLAPRQIKIRVGLGTEVVQAMPGWAPVGYGGPAPTDWPDTPPTINPQDPIEFTPNGSTADPVDTATATPPANLPAPGSGDCAGYLTADFELDPILNLDYGEQFPFGVFAWVGDQLAVFNVSAVAPEWDIPVIGPDGWTEDYHIDLDPFSPYMSTMRTVLAWVLWIGSLWFVAATFLGIRSTGNPADAVDDYLDQII